MSDALDRIDEPSLQIEVEFGNRCVRLQVHTVMVLSGGRRKWL